LDRVRMALVVAQAGNCQDCEWAIRIKISCAAWPELFRRDPAAHDVDLLPHTFATVVHQLVDVETADRRDEMRIAHLAGQHRLTDIDVMCVRRKTVRNASQTMDDV